MANKLHDHILSILKSAGMDGSRLVMFAVEAAATHGRASSADPI